MKSICVIVLVYFGICLNLIESAVRFTNVKCDEYHPEFATFEKCHLKVVGRGIIALNIDVKLWQVPVTNVSARLSLFKKANGYLPILYNQTLDFCKAMQFTKSKSFQKVFYDIFLRKYSNINHTCPFAHNIIVKDVILNENKFRFLPLPQGDYMFQVLVGAYNDWKANVKMYVSISNDL